MVFNHNRYLNYELPTDWCAEENEDTLVIYNPNGDGAMVLSFFNVLTDEKTVDEQISILAKRFVDQNRIKLKSPFIIMPPKSNKTVLFGTGKDEDGWFVKLWVVANQRKIVFVTYQSEKSSREVCICDTIVESFAFIKEP